jgi:hypothetical protein
MVWLLRILLVFLIIFFLYIAVKLLFGQHRKIETAVKHKRFMFVDSEDVRKNFMLAYKGALFSGEKYMGASDHTFEVVSISVSSKDPSALKGLIKEDFQLIEQKIREKYPKAEIFWHSPIKEFLQKN